MCYLCHFCEPFTVYLLYTRLDGAYRQILIIFYKNNYILMIFKEN
ncbi:hypothetical protein HMPREF9370_0794 [Neisseria wadsworthii 9715]|uniref:Uncharacterized protein n=1 Tax=Neisseria wadsworthii 9715 TaxID=1030841 RepID=G4CNY5_9NEIS|nr:hypothetical protein HMPREF9370_0794 [Neisseria wadsworthii 9715]